MKQFLLLSLFIVSIALNAQETKTTVVYGVNHGYALSAPEGWVMDNKSGRDLGLPAVAYPQGSAFQNAEVVMYSRVAHLQGKKAEEIIDGDIAAFRSASETMTVRKVGTVNAGATTAVVYEFIDDTKGNYEEVAYITMEKVVVIIVLGSRKQAVFNKNKSAFLSLVDSYLWMPEAVMPEP